MLQVTKLADLRNLLAEINNLKRIRTADAKGSLAERGFYSAWSALLPGNSGNVALYATGQSLVRVKLGGIDQTTLRAAGLTGAQASLLEKKAFGAVDSVLDPDLKEQLRANLHTPFAIAAPPAFVNLLCEQPRAGATRPGHARVIVLPPESHAEHCFTVAVYSVLLAPRFGADPAIPFLAALSHHLHNAYLPDSGFAGEELLGEFLAPVMQAFQYKALSQLDGRLAGEVMCALARTATADSPEGKTFHAADVLDRVLQMKWYEDAAAFTLRAALEEMELVHAGPVRDFHMDVLREAGLC